MSFLCGCGKINCLTETQTHSTPALFENRAVELFGHTPSVGQRRLFYAFTRFLFSDKPRCALLLRGYAGTGKTTCVSALVKTLSEFGINYVLLAPTGRAARVLSNYSGQSARTIHKQIYYSKQSRTGDGIFELKENQLSRTIFFVDEASMIGHHGVEHFNDLLDDLIAHVYSGEECKLVLIGDNAQLPPVGCDESPALQIEHLRNSYYLHIAELELSEVIRQEEGSGILDNATRLREQITSGKHELPHLQVGNHKDVVRVTGDLQEYLEQAFERYGKDETILITRSNKRANLFNQQIRHRILWHEEEINAGDRMMVLKNNYFWIKEGEFQAGFIANGDIIRIIRVLRYEDRETFRFCKAIVKLIDYPEMPEFETILLCDSIMEDGPSLKKEKIQALAELIAADYPEITDRRHLRKKIMEDPYYNALQVKFAYAVTCHKAQGGQWPCVFVDQGYLTDEMTGISLNRWFYTAFTRSQEKLFLLGFEDRLFEAT